MGGKSEEKWGEKGEKWEEIWGGNGTEMGKNVEKMRQKWGKFG